MDVITTHEHVETDSTRLPKRQKIAHDDSWLTLRHDEYTIAWICALYIEKAAARAVLDEIHEPLPVPKNDSNTYILGRIKKHNVVIACLPVDKYGIINAANVVTNMRRTFPAIRAGLMVGIGGGVPGGTDIRLGDIVVGTRVMQIDLGKITGDGQLEHTGIPKFPDQILATAVSSLRAKHELVPSGVPSIVQQKLHGYGYGRPSLPDRLFHATYDHEHSQENCDQCDVSKTTPRSSRSSDDPVIHYGAISSGSQVVKSSTFRDNVARELKVICFEMEAAGLMDILPCLPIRGICDYSDSHKSKEWQRYAAATAAAYATELLQELPVTEADTRETRRLVREQGPSQGKRQLTLDSLKFKQIDARRTNIKTAHAETCRWFLSHQDYKAWLDQSQLTQHHGFLWVSGKPGAGKSTIMKFAYSSMKKTRNKGAVTASFFFNARGEYLERSIIGMYRSLLLQLLEGYPDLQSILDDPNLAPPSENISLSLNALKDLIYSAVLALGHRSFTCFVDALDECDEQQVIDMIQYFEDLAEQSTAKGVKFRVCFSSRHYPYLSIRWGLRFTLERQPGHTKDLETYVESRLQIRDPMLIQKLRPELLKKAAGVFMWVALVVDILNKEYRRGAMFMEKKLKQLPSGLSDLFKDILQRDEENTEELKLCIIWILCAKRPLQPREFYHALWSGLSFQDPDEESEIPDASDSEIAEDDLPRFHRYVISSSKGLAEVTNSTNQSVQFIHESVRDFLIKDKGLYELWPELGADWKNPSHELLKQCCSFYITHRAVRDSVNMLPEGDKSDNQTIILEKYPFLGYAGEFIFYHANTAAKVVPQDEFLSSFQLLNWIKINNLLEKYRVREYSLNASLYYILAERTSPELIRTRLKKDRNIHVVGERYNYPLFAALASGEKENIAALLGSPSNTREGVDITKGLEFTRDPQTYRNRTPLSWAIENGRGEIVNLLLQAGTSVNEVDTRGDTPLLQASCNGHEIITRILLDHGAGVNTRGKNRQTPLLKALSNQHEKTARILLNHGAEVDTRNNYGQTPLLLASSHGFDNIIQILLDKGAEVNTCDKNGQMPLLEALSRQHEKTARILLNHGAEVDTRNNYGQTPLLLASFHGFDNVIQILFDKGATANPYYPAGRTAFSRALSKGHESTAGLLIDRGAMININTCDEYGRTPLLEALSNGHEEVARTLLDLGAELSTSNTSPTELEWALRRGYHEVSITLMKRGARVMPGLVVEWEAALDFIISGFDVYFPGEIPLNLTAVARQLPENGFDLVVTGYEVYINAVHTALLLRCPEIAKWLLEREPSIEPDDFIKNADKSSSFMCLPDFIPSSSLLDIEFAIQCGVDLNSANGFTGQTALHKATQSNKQEMVNMLLEKGSNPNLRDKLGMTPLHYAAKNGHEEITRRLLDVTETTLIDSNGRTALRYARDNNHVSIVRLLLSSRANSDVCTDIHGKTLEDWMDIVRRLDGTD